MKSMRSAKSLLLLGAFTVALLLSVGYATLSQDLSAIKGDKEMNKTGIVFFDVQIKKVEATDIYGAASGETPIYTKDQVNFSSQLFGPDDTIIYTITIKNEGKTSAKLEELNLSEDQDGSEPIFYSLTGPSDILAAGEETTLQVVASYNSQYIGNITSNVKSAVATIKYIPTN